MIHYLILARTCTGAPSLCDRPLTTEENDHMRRAHCTTSPECTTTGRVHLQESPNRGTSVYGCHWGQDVCADATIILPPPPSLSVVAFLLVLQTRQHMTSVCLVLTNTTLLGSLDGSSASIVWFPVDSVVAFLYVSGCRWMGLFVPGIDDVVVAFVVLLLNSS